MSDHPRPGLLRRVLFSNTMFAFVAIVALAVAMIKIDVGESDPPAIAADGLLSTNDALALLDNSDLDVTVADAVAAAKKRAHDRQVRLDKIAKAKAEWYRKNKKKIDASKSAAAIAKIANPSEKQNKALGKQLNSLKGWDRCWPDLLIMWTKESNWNERADNPTSDAYGIPQSLPGSKMASAGPNWQTNAATQIAWGLGYIKARYQDPCKAWDFWQANHWY